MDEESDLALLDQHLIKTNLLSQRMTSILAQLDTRLSRLDKTIAPLGIQPLSRKAQNIDAVLSHLNPSQPIQQPQGRSTPVPRQPSNKTQNPTSGLGIKGYSVSPSPSTSSLPSTSKLAVPRNGTGTSSPADETALLLRGPDIMALGEYFAALDGVIGDLERMWKGFKEGRGGAREAGVKDLSRMVEMGLSGLTQLFLKIAKESSQKLLEIDHLVATGPSTPPNHLTSLPTLLPIAQKISSLLHPASPTPKTETIIQPLFEGFVSELADVRGDLIRRSFGGMIGRLEDEDMGLGASRRGEAGVMGLMSLWEGLIVVIETETLLITTLFPNHPPENLLPFTLQSPISTISSTLTPTINTIKKSLSTQTFLALDLYQNLLRVSSKWEQTISKCLSMTGNTSRESQRELMAVLNGPINSLRSLIQRSFPELLVDIRTSPPSSSTSTIHNTTHSTLTYLETLPTYQLTVSALLGGGRSERTWLMGAKEPPSSVRSAAEEGGIVELFVADVLGTLIQWLEGVGRSMRRPSGQTFVLNNLSHVRNTTASLNSDIIGPGAEDMLNKAFRDAKNAYITEITQPLLSSLQPQSTPRFAPLSTTNERQQLKETLTAFFDKLSETETLVKQYPLSRGDVEMRERVGKEVTDLISGREGFAGIWSKSQGKSVDKYLRNTPDEVTRRVQAMFR